MKNQQKKILVEVIELIVISAKMILNKKDLFCHK